MVRESVQTLSYDDLSARESEPEAVTASVPIGDVVQFVQMLARNPLMATPNARALKNIAGDLRDRQSQEMLAAFRPRRRNLKRKYPIAAEDTLSEELTDDEGSAPRRSTRAKVQQTNGTSSVDEEIRNVRGNPPKIGGSHQASVPPDVIPLAKRSADMVKVASDLVYSPSMCVNDDRISQFLDRVNALLCKRDGFPLSPRGLETALRKLAEKNGQVGEACEAVLPLVGSGVEYPGAGEPWSIDEKCRYVRAVGETNKNFAHISRHVMKDRATSELVVMYYTYYKQQKLQHGRPTGGLIFDVGTERPHLASLGPERIASALKHLARSSNDGFPADRRLASGVSQHRALARMRKESRNGTRSGRNNMWREG